MANLLFEDMFKNFGDMNICDSILDEEDIDQHFDCQLPKSKAPGEVIV